MLTVAAQDAIYHRPYQFVDEELIGDVKIQLDMVTPAVFFAGSLQEIIVSGEFVQVPQELQEKLGHLSFLAHLMIKYDDFHTLYRLHTKFMGEFYRSKKSWDDTEYLRQLQSGLKTELEEGDLLVTNGFTFDSSTRDEDSEIRNQEYKQEQPTPKHNSYSIDYELFEQNFDQETKDDHFMENLDNSDNDMAAEDENGADSSFFEHTSQSSMPKKRRPGRPHGSKSAKTKPKDDAGCAKKKRPLNSAKRKKTAEAGSLVDAKVEDDFVAKGVETTIFCPECNKDVVVMEGETLKRHLREHHPIMFTCPHCSFSRKSSISIQKHMQEAHPDEKEVKILCPHCGEVSTTFKSHVSHVRRFHTNILMCPNCPATFTTKHRLRNHQKTAHNIVDHEAEEENESKKEICPFCGKLIKNLPHHIYSLHTKHKMQKCMLCDYTSRVPSAVKLHFKRIHNKPAVCPKCNKTVKFLDQHMRRASCGVPTEERRKFNCEYCGKSFTSSTHLKRHVNNIHQKAKDRECPHCHYRTTNDFNLDIHIKRVHEGKHLKTECHFCGKQVFGVDSHVKAYHQEELLSSSGYTFQTLSEMKMVTDVE